MSETFSLVTIEINELLKLNWYKQKRLDLTHFPELNAFAAKHIPEFNNLAEHQGRLLAKVLRNELHRYLITESQGDYNLDNHVKLWLSGLLVIFQYLLPESGKLERDAVVDLLQNRDVLGDYVLPDVSNREQLINMIMTEGSTLKQAGKLISATYNRKRTDGVEILARAVLQAIDPKKQRFTEILYPEISTFVPSTTVLRKDLVKQAMSLLSGPTETGNSRIIGICGMPGTGKTTLARMIMRELAERLEKVIGVRPAGAVFPVNNLTLGADTDDDLRKLRLLRLGAHIGIALDRHLPADTLRAHISSALATGHFILVLDDIQTQDWEDFILGNQNTFIIAVSHRREALSEVIPLSAIIPVHSFNAAEWETGLLQRSPGLTDAERESGIRIGNLLKYYPLALGAVTSTAAVIGWSTLETRLRRAVAPDFGITLSPELVEQLASLLSEVYDSLSSEGKFCYESLATWSQGWKVTGEIYDATFSEESAKALWSTAHNTEWSMERTQARLTELVRSGLIQLEPTGTYFLHQLILEDCARRWEKDAHRHSHTKHWYVRLPWWPELKPWLSLSFALLLTAVWFLLTVIFFFFPYRLIIVTILIAWAAIISYAANSGLRGMVEIIKEKGWGYLWRLPDSVALVLTKVQKKRHLTVDMYGMMQKLARREMITRNLIVRGIGILLIVIITGVMVVASVSVFSLNQSPDWERLRSWRDALFNIIYILYSIGTALLITGITLKSRLLTMPEKFQGHLSDDNTE